MLAAMAAFVVNDTLLKIAGEALPTGEAIFLRGLLTTLFCASLLFSHGAPGALPHAVSPKIIGRAIAEIGSTLFFLSALVHMPIGDVIAILQFTPLAITAGAALFLGDKVGWRRWLATCVGLLGVLDHRAAGRDRLQSLFGPGTSIDPVRRRSRPADARHGVERALAPHRRHVVGRRRRWQVSASSPSKPG